MLSTIGSLLIKYALPTIFTYLTQNAAPIFGKVKEIERDYKDAENSYKKKLLFDYSWIYHPELGKILNGRGWNEQDFKALLDAGVLISKKGYNPEKWNDDDFKVAGHFFAILAKKWMPILSKVRKK